MVRQQFIISGMHSKDCEEKVRKALEKNGATGIRMLLSPSIRKGMVACESGTSRQILIDAIERAGYKVVG